MDGGLHPALFLMQRFILGPACVAFLAFGGWALAESHWLSATLLLTACFFAAVIAYGLSKREPEALVSEAALASEEEREPDDSQALASAIVKTNILFSCLLMGLVWSERLPLIRTAVFVVLFSILFPAAAALFCTLGEQMMLRAAGAQGRTHHGPPRHSGATRAH